MTEKMKDRPGIPEINENPKGHHKKYLIKKIVGVNGYDRGYFGSTPIYKTEDCDPNAEYFIMRLDKYAKDKIHVEACRMAVLRYAELIKDHLPELSKDLIKRYSQ